MKTQKAKFYFGLLKIKSKGTLSYSQIAQFLSKRENMAKKFVWGDLNECNASKGPLAPTFGYIFILMSFRSYEFFGLLKILPYDFRNKI